VHSHPFSASHSAAAAAAHAYSIIIARSAFECVELPAAAGETLKIETGGCE